MKAAKKPTLSKVRSAYGVEEYALTNGLRVLYRREKAAPIAAVCVTYHVGSRNEEKGHTGSTHILEHLLFKDTEHFKKAEGADLSKKLEQAGALMNATTWLDRTNYFEAVPNDQLELALSIEADRMRGSLFSDADLAVEMTVVRNEYERSRNNPFELLNEEVWMKTFSKHPYRIPTIGTKEDIEASTAKKLREFYDTYYWPNNATLMVAGDVSFAEVKKLILTHFGRLLPSPRPIPKMRVAEPAQTKPRAVVLKKPMGVSIVEIQYKVCRARDKDFPALLALSTILGGGFGSRLQHALVDTGLAAESSAYALALFDPGIMSLGAHVAEGAKPAGVLAAMRREVRRIAREGVTADELARAKERILSHSAAERDGAFAQVRTVSEAVAAGDWTLAYRLQEEVGKLTVQKVSRAAAKYMVPTNETSGLLINA